jgi:hypothetical protein
MAKKEIQPDEIADDHEVAELARLIASYVPVQLMARVHVYKTAKVQLYKLWLQQEDLIGRLHDLKNGLEEDINGLNDAKRTVSSILDDLGETRG